ncbi:NO-inducible flavohemoprotein [Vreelandella utahensis]|uniref:NO-inducible flavohemoprotein n=1 Tax=Vreelandella halophila TaxID=86177 RepID=UPI0009849B42|nr:NO-inducible flavohemoprotein [Halomonas utahensis]
MLSSKQEQIIEETAPVVAQHLETITARFYPLMFDRYPEVNALFNASHQASGNQARALAGAVLQYVQLRNNPAEARAALSTAIGKHISLGIQPDHYPIVGECLMAAIGEVLGDAVTPDVADAWQALYDELAGLLIDVEQSHYHAFANRPGGWQGRRAFRIRNRRQESAVITSFELEPMDGEPVADFEPGQYIGVRLEINGEPVYRHYSLSDVPNGRTYRISVKREPEGHVSRFLHDEAANGFELELLPPSGDLTLTGQEPLLLISGGVGQTPMLPLAKQALEQGRPVAYLHAARSRQHHAFSEEIKALRDQYPEHFNPVVIYEEGGEADGADAIGMVDQTLLAQHLPDPAARCYFVGPEAFMQTVDAALDALGVSENRRHFEYFGPSRPLRAA